MNTRTPNSFDYRKQNLDILKTQAQLQSNMPGEYDADAWAMGELRALGQKRKPASGFHALLDGMMIGAESNMKKQKYEKLRGQLEIYSDYASSMREKNEWFEKKEAEKESMIPFADAGIRLAYQGGSYEETMGGLKNVWDQAKLSNPNLKGDFVSYIPNSSIINVRDNQTGKIIPFDLGSISPTAYKMEQDNYLKRQGLSIQQQNADAYGRSVNSNVDYHNAMINKANNPPHSPKENSSEIKNIEKQMGHLEEILDEYNSWEQAEQLLVKKDKDGKVITDKNGKPQLSNEALQTNPLSLYFYSETPAWLRSPEQAQFLNTTSDLKGKHFKKMKYRNRTEYENIKTLDPRADAEANYAVIQSNKESLKPYLDRYYSLDNKLSELRGYEIPGLPSKINPSNAPATPQGMSQPIQNSDPNTITMRSPEGKIGKIPLSKSEDAIKMGFVLIE